MEALTKGSGKSIGMGKQDTTKTSAEYIWNELKVIDTPGIDSIYPGKTICKYTLCKTSSKSSTAFVKYVVDNKLYLTNVGGCPVNSDEKINKFFFVKYLTLDPNKIQVHFSREGKNKAEIEELEYKIKYWLDLR